MPEPPGDPGDGSLPEPPRDLPTVPPRPEELPTVDLSPPLDTLIVAGGEAGEAPADSKPDYLLFGELGRGGMGVVYLARDIALDREVALKVLSCDFAPGSTDEMRFLREVKITAQLQHSGIPPVYRAGRLPNGRPCLAMKRIRGHTLDELLAERGGGAARWIGVFEDICRAVGFAHTAGYIHRDLKLSNVMIEGDKGLVMDWGLAKNLLASREREGLEQPSAPIPHAPRSLAPNDTRTPPHDPTVPDGSTNYGAVVGTPSYLAPEQARGEIDRLDRRTDVFALGGILCRLLTGFPPFTGSYPEVIEAATAGNLSAAFARLNACDEHRDLVALTKRCLSADPDSRPTDANEVAEAVATFRRETQAREKKADLARDKAEVQASELRKRRVMLLWSAAAVVAVLLAGLGVSIAMLVRAMAAERLAKTNEQAATQNAQLARDERDAKDIALKGEVKAKGEAEMSLIRSKKSFDILSSVFTGLDPKQQALTLGELRTLLKTNLLKAAKELEGSAVGDPLEVARMQNTLGRTLWGLGEAKLAIELLKKAATTYQEKLGRDDPTTLTSLNNLAVVYDAADQPDQAMTLHEEVYARRKQTLGADHPDTLVSMNNLGSSYLAAGKLDQALPLQEECYKLSKARLKGDHPLTLACMGQLTEAYRRTGKPDKALVVAVECYTLSKAKLGADHTDTLTALNNLGTCYLAIGKPAEALPLLEQCYQLRKEQLGADHRLTLTCMGNLAVAYRDAGKPDKAVPLGEECHKLCKAKLGPDDRLTLKCLSNLASGYRSARKPDKALAAEKECYELSKAKLGADDPFTLTGLCNLAEGYHIAGEPDKSHSLCEECYTLRKKKLGPENADTLISLSNLALSHWGLGRREKGITLLEEAYTLRKKAFGADHFDTLESLNFLAKLNYDIGRRDKALPLFEEAHKLRKAKQGANHPDTLFCLNNLAVGYAETGNGEKAAETFAAVLEIKRKMFAKGTPALALELLQASSYLLKCGQHATAEPLLQECLTTLDKTQPDDWRTFDVRSSLGLALLAQKKYADSEPMLVKAYEGLKKCEKAIPKGETCIPDTLDRLVELYTATDKPDETKKYKELRGKYPMTKPAPPK